MNTTDEIKQKFEELVYLSLDAIQINFLGQSVDGKFNLYNESKHGKNVPIPRQTAASLLLKYFKREEDIIKLFTQMLRLEGRRISGTTIRIVNSQNFIKLLEKNKWVYDKARGTFNIDPFYENELAVLKSLRLIDLRREFSAKQIIKDIKDASNTMSIQDLEWRITVRLYEINDEKEQLIRHVIELLLARQNLKEFTNDIYVCLKELTINASKANYKLLFEKYFTAPMGITADKKYKKFLSLFKGEISENGKSRLSELAKRDDMYFNVSFQSKKNSIGIWVSNYTVITEFEKERLMEKIKDCSKPGKILNSKKDKFSEGAGFGIFLIMSILKNYSDDEEPLKVIVYPDFIKIGFELQRSKLRRNI